jgi:hypothetical protein
MAYRAAADALLVIHTLFVGFVVIGQVLILAGVAGRWAWVRNFWFRGVHLLAILVVVLESWTGVVCPLTQWEIQLRKAAGQGVYKDGFIAHWLHELLYIDAPTWVFTLGYTLFGVIVLASFIAAPPRWPGSRAARRGNGEATCPRSR